MLQDLAVAFRKLISRPLASLIIIVTLAVGIGANTAIYSVVEGVLYETAPYEEVDRLVWIGEHSEQVPNMSVAYPNFLDWREQASSFASMAAHRYDGFNLTGLDRPEQVWAVYASPSLFEEVLRKEPVLGRIFSQEEDQPGKGAVVVVSHSFWQTRLGGRADAVGSTFLLDGDPYEVIGVMPPGFVYPLFTDRVQMWLPIGHISGESWMTSRGNHPGIYVTARLKDGVDLEQAESEMLGLAAALAEEHPNTNTGNSITLQPLREFVVANLRPAVLTLAVAVALVLLLACVNVANLLLVRG
ncbi:MAG: ABC transporter permease, partial [Holophagales bacterium]|nr:ABC transporter permease [Holophagales bacterium]